jgi:RND family efflux transporter MFP subunit
MKAAMRNMIVLTILLALISCGGKKEAAVEEKPVAVTISPATISSMSVTKTYTGTIEGWRQARIYASIPEAVVELPVYEGREVSAGQPVIILDKEGRASQVPQAKAVYDDAKDNYEKMTRLYQQGAISEQTYNNLKTNLDVAKANYEAARQQVELTSPISGVLTDLAVNIGQYVSLGVPLATIAQVDKMRMTFFVDSRSASFLKQGQLAKIEVEAIGALSSQGKITEVARSADPETRLFKVETQIDNSDRRLNPGMFARATITVNELSNVLTIPREAVFTTEGIAKVYRLKDNRASEQSIEIGEGTLSSYQVISGLNEGENVIVLGRDQVSDGTLVKVVEQSGNSTESSKES